MIAALLLSGLLGLFGPSSGGDRPAAQSANAARAPLADRLARRGFAPGSAVHIRIFKAENRLEVWLKDGARYRLFETYPICRWSGALGPKLREGDGQSPEGFYSVARGAMNPNSSYHKSFNLGFPNRFDQQNGRTGSYLMVHGECVSVGCYAMTNQGIDDIWALMMAGYGAGQRAVAVDAFPFRMTDDNLARHAGDPNIGFWRDLAEGDRRFKTDGRPAAVWSCQRRYRYQAGASCVVVRAGG